MARRRNQPSRVPGAPHATTVVMVDLLPGTYAYADTYRDSPPLLVIDTGYTELHLSLPGEEYTMDDLLILDAIVEACTGFRLAATPRLR